MQRPGSCWGSSRAAVVAAAVQLSGSCTSTEKIEMSLFAADLVAHLQLSWQLACSWRAGCTMAARQLPRQLPRMHMNRHTATATATATASYTTLGYRTVGCMPITTILLTKKCYKNSDDMYSVGLCRRPRALGLSVGLAQLSANQQQAPTKRKREKYDQVEQNKNKNDARAYMHGNTGQLT